MTYAHCILALCVFAVVPRSGGVALAGEQRASSQPPTGHLTKRLHDAQWRSAGPGLALAALEGDATQEGRPYAVLLRIDSGAWIPPHWHPNDKRILVVDGELLMGHGDVMSAATAERVERGSFVLVPAKSHHFEGANGQTTLILYGTGPLTTNLVQPPR